MNNKNLNEEEKDENLEKEKQEKEDKENNEGDEKNETPGNDFEKGKNPNEEYNPNAFLDKYKSPRKTDQLNIEKIIKEKKENNYSQITIGL